MDQPSAKNAVQQSIRAGMNTPIYCCLQRSSLALARLEPGVVASMRSERSHRRGAA